MTAGEKAALAADVLKQAFDHSAEFRRERASEFPDDKRNAEAVGIFERLTASLGQVHLVDLQRVADLNVHDDEPLRTTEIMQEMLKSVGFSYWPDSASTFVRDYIARNVH